MANFTIRSNEDAQRALADLALNLDAQGFLASVEQYSDDLEAFYDQLTVGWPQPLWTIDPLGKARANPAARSTEASTRNAVDLENEIRSKITQIKERESEIKMLRRALADSQDENDRLKRQMAERESTGQSLLLVLWESLSVKPSFAGISFDLKQAIDRTHKILSDRSAPITLGLHDFR